jgi:LmbE family N-acetylglucosaminyl deacetylase
MLCAPSPSRRSSRRTLVRSAATALALGALVGLAACGDRNVASGPAEALVVVSPHPDDESIFGAATIHRLAADPQRFVRAIYVSGGDKASVPGDCNGIPEAEKAAQIVALREGETRAAWRVLAPDRDVPISFLRGPDMGLVASSTLVDGVRQDQLTDAGTAAVAAAVPIAMDLPASVRRVLILTASIYDAHPDHRTAYRAARTAADRLRAERGLEVELWSWIVHDEIANPNPPTCCIGDLHWPAPGPSDDYLALTDSPERPRPPRWDRSEEAGGTIRRDALAQHVSQVVGYPPLCMPVYVPSFYTRWTDKTEEPFYVEKQASPPARSG